MYLIKRTPRQNGEGGWASRNTTALSNERRRGKERRKAVGTAESSKSGSDQARQEPSIKDAVQGSEGSVVNRSLDCIRTAFLPTETSSGKFFSHHFQASSALFDEPLTTSAKEPRDICILLRAAARSFQTFFAAFVFVVLVLIGFWGNPRSLQCGPLHLAHKAGALADLVHSEVRWPPEHFKHFGALVQNR
ncbi:hypothetical protein TNCV_2910561 [Trichonephila clavipes]|nr:hypothetical protein TNCV_2910561 [Trichonephila clavipes]